MAGCDNYGKLPKSAEKYRKLTLAVTLTQTLTLTLNRKSLPYKTRSLTPNPILIIITNFSTSFP